MPTLVSKEDLKDTLSKFRNAGDAHWALKSELPNEDDIKDMINDALDGDTIKGMVDEALEDADVVTHPEVGELSRSEINEILAEAH